MVDFMLLEDDSVSKIVFEDDSGDAIIADDASPILGKEFTIYSVTSTATAGLLRFPNRTFVLSFGLTNKDDEMRDIFTLHQEHIKVESAGQEEQVSAKVPEFVELWDGETFRQIQELEGTEITTLASARLVALGFVEGEDQFLFYGPIEVLIRVHAAIALAVTSSFKQISHSQLFNAETVADV